MLFQPLIKYAQSSLPWFHSWAKPKNKIINTIIIRHQVLNALSLTKLKIRGNNKTNSTSKIKKIKAIRKNRIEKGRRALSFGENPHSNGLNLSRSKDAFFLRKTPSLTTTALRITTINTLK